MTISITVSACDFEGDGTSKVFPIKDGSNGIYFEDATEITVKVDGSVVSSSAYTISGAGTYSGYVTFITAPANGAVGRIERNTALTQTLSLTRGGYLPPEDAMAALDKSRRIDQDLSRRIGDLESATEGATDVIALADGAWQGEGYPTTGFGAATESTGLATYGQVQEMVLAAGTGDVVGPPSAVDQRVAVFDGTTGKVLADGGLAISDLVAADDLEVVFVDSFAGANDNAKISAAITYAKTLTNAYIKFPRRAMTLTTTATIDPPDHSTIDMRGCIITSSAPGSSLRIGSTSRNPIGYHVLGVNVARASVDHAGSSVGVEIRNVCLSYVQIAWVRDHTYGVLLSADQANGGISYSRFDLQTIHDNRYSLSFSYAGSGYINENSFYGGSFNHSSLFPTGVTTIHLNIPDGVPVNNNKFYGPSFEDGQSTTYVQAMLFGSMAVANTVYHWRWENNADQTGHAIRFRPGSYGNALIGGGNYTTPDCILDESDGKNSWQTSGGDFVSRRVSASSGAIVTYRSYWEDGAKLFSFENVAGAEQGWIRLDGSVALTLANCTGLPVSTGISGLGTGVATFLATPSSANLRAALSDETGTGAAMFNTAPTIIPASSATPANNGDLVIQATSNTSLTFKLKGSDGTVRSGSVTLT